MSFDTAIIQTLHESVSSTFLDKFFVVITKLGDYGLIWILLALVLLAKKKYRNLGIMIILVLILDVIVVSGILKPLFSRPRPFAAMNLPILIDVPYGSSFPSGHSSSSMSVAAMTYFNRLKGWQAVLILALLIIFSRIYLLVHYPSDVVAGSFIGIINAYIVYKLWGKYEKERDL